MSVVADYLGVDRARREALEFRSVSKGVQAHMGTA